MAEEASVPRRRRKPRKNRLARRRLAVDQHVTFPLLHEEPEAVLDESSTLQPQEPQDVVAVTLPPGTRCNQGKFYCDTCRLSCLSRRNLEEHVHGRRHILTPLIKKIKSNRLDVSFLFLILSVIANSDDASRC